MAPLFMILIMLVRFDSTLNKCNQVSLGGYCVRKVESFSCQPHYFHHKRGGFSLTPFLLQYTTQPANLSKACRCITTPIRRPIDIYPTMTEMEPPQTSSTLLSPEGLYFQIVCDPGHERTTRELHQLPRESRERVWADMTGANLDTRKSFCHSSFGSNSDLHPHPEGNSSLKVNKHLEKLNNEINLLPRTEALELALNSQVGKDSEFRLAFLRTCDFDETQAAERFGRHFDQKMALFGKAKVGLPIRLQDLSADDLESLKCGAIQFLPKTDRGGRLVLVSRYRDFVYKHRNNMVSTVVAPPLRGTTDTYSLTKCSFYHSFVRYGTCSCLL